MRAKDFIPASKPRNFVAKNQKTAGAGAHKDKKKADKQGDVKHKGKAMAEAGSPAQQAAIAINMKKHHKKPEHKDVEEGWDDIKKFGKKAAVTGAIGLGALGGAQAQDAPSGEDFLPDIVAHVTFKIDGKTISKDINLGTAYKSPGQAGDALAKFLKSKGIKYYDYSLERVKPKDKDYLDKAPYTDSGKTHGQMDTGPAVDTKSKNDYMSKD